MTLSPPPTILVTDDEEHVREFIARVLRHHGYEIVEAIHGLDALAKLRQQSFDLLITDLNMPEMDGLTLLEECRSAYPETDMLMLTAYGTIETAVHAMKVGALDFCTKPFGITDLEEKVERCLRLHQQRMENAERSTVKALAKLGQLLADPASLDETLDGIVDLINQVFQPEHVCLRTYTQDGNESSVTCGDVSNCVQQELSQEDVSHIAERPDAWLFATDEASEPGELPWAGRTVTVPLSTDRAVIGSLTLSRGEGRTSYTRQDAELLLVFAGQIAMAKAADRQRSRMLLALRDLDAHRQVAVDTLKEALGAFDDATREHSQRVARYAHLLGEEVGIKGHRLHDLYVGALLHDIGKIGIENQYVAKPGSLTSQELDQVKLHPTMGAKILRDAPGMDMARAIILTHHERLDGNGYPHRLSGDEIPYEGKLVAVVDSFDSMTSDRPYRAALSVKTALKQLRAGAGVTLDAELVDAWERMVKSGAYLN